MIDAVCKNDLCGTLGFDDNFGIGKYDYFSPYFNLADVAVGFHWENGANDKISKIVTLSHSGTGRPNVKRCSYWIPGHFLTIKKSRNQTYWRCIGGPSVANTDELLKLHMSSEGYKKTEIEIRASISEPSDFVQATKLAGVAEKIFEQSLSINIKACKTLSPVRALPERFYSSKRKLDVQGSHFARMWSDIYVENDPLSKNILDFGRESGLFDSFDVSPLTDKVEDPPLLVLVGGHGKKFTLYQVGIGISQVAPILIESVLAAQHPRHPLLLQQPELHLHPVGQAAFGSYFYRAAVAGLRGVLETHSSFLIDRFRSEMRDRCKSEDAQDYFEEVSAEIVFCQSNQKGNKSTYIPINADGSISGEPEEYHRFFVDELIRTMI